MLKFAGKRVNFKDKNIKYFFVNKTAV